MVTTGKGGILSQIKIKSESIMKFTNPHYMYNIGQQQHTREHMLSTCTHCTTTGQLFSVLTHSVYECVST